MTDPKDSHASIPFDLTETDRQNLEAGDENFQPHTWEDLKVIIADNNLSILKRKPSDLTRYIAWTNTTKSTYGSMTTFILQERLHWTPLAGLSSSSSSSSPSSSPSFDLANPTQPLVSPSDFTILLNDWPYGFTPEITHIVVWLKHRLPVTEPEGRLTPEGIALVEDFVEKTFVKPLGEGGERRVLWFKNWVGLQSVRGVEHFHVLVRDAPAEVVEGWLEGRGRQE